MNRIQGQLLNEMEILVDLLAERAPQPKFVMIARLRAYRDVEPLCGVGDALPPWHGLL